MGTTKKTKTNGTAKAAKTAVKAKTNGTAKAARTDYKVGTRVLVTRRDGSKSKGTVAKIEEKATGHFVHVTVLMPKVIKARPVAVRSY